MTSKLSKDVIIFHPGSRHLYFGRASDPSPQSVLHIIARKRTSSSPKHIRRDTIVPVSEKRLAEPVPHKVESARLQLSLTLQTALKSVGVEKSEGTVAGEERRILLTDIPSLAARNKVAGKTQLLVNRIPPPVIVEQLEDKPFVVGEDVLHIAGDKSFNIFCPWRRGQLNINREVGGSITGVIKDLEDIWRWALVQKLEIPVKEIRNYKVVLIVPVMFDRVHAKEMMNLLLNQLGFKSAFLVQDHVCATFGCGINCATVLDIGDQKISVSCVDDGISYPQSRLELKYGGGDLTVALWNQFRLTEFPVRLDMSKLWDQEFLNRLKEKYCNLDLKSWRSGSREEKICFDKPDEIHTEYTVHFGDELYIVPLSYFNPDLLRGSIGSKSVIFYAPQPSMSDDPFDKNYLTETAPRRKACVTVEDWGEDDEFEELPSELIKTFDIPIGIGNAVLQSIGSCDVSENLKHRLYSGLIVVGGGGKFPGLLDWLQKWVNSFIPLRKVKTDEDENGDVETFAYDGTERPHIFTSAKNEGDPSTTVWKGGAILSSLGTAKELWISEEEWRKLGSKILRVRSIFHY